VSGNAASSDREDRLQALVATALEALERGEEVDPAELCAQWPELASELAAVLGLGGSLRALHVASLSGESRLGETIAGRYRIDAWLGRGASGSVFRAHDLELQRDVALKLLHADTLIGPAAEARFLREAELLAQHEHRHLVRVYDRGHSADGTQFLVTELLVGIGLAELLERMRAAMPDGASAGGYADASWLAAQLPQATLERSTLRQCVRWIAELGDGLAVAHAKGVFHRDVKPSNAFVRADGSAVLLDFGIAARVGDASLTLQTTVLGTPWYMAPEQARGRVEPSPSLDVYGLAATLYHLVTLQPPHGAGRSAEDLEAVLAAAREGETVPASRWHPGLPRDLEAILDRGLEPEPGRRYADVPALVADLRAFLDHRAVAARPIGALGRAWRRTRRRPARALATGLGITSLVLFAIAWPLAAQASAEAETREGKELRARLAADLCIEGWGDQRALVPTAERDSAIRELDRLLELDPDDLAIRLLRASERLDAGERVAAAADFEAIAQRSDSPYLRAVAARYAAADSSLAGIAAVQLGGLPEPHSPQERFVAGFHALRARDIDSALTWLDGADELLHARDLRLLALLGARRWDDAAREAHELEVRYGRSTARTRHTLAAAALGQREYEAAAAFARDALALRPDRHGPWNNLGYALLRQAKLDEARTSFERAVAIRPWFDNSRAGLCQALRSLEDFAAARTEAQKLGAVWWREWELANVDLAEAMAAHRAGRIESCRELANAAALRFAHVRDDASEENQKRTAAPASIAFAEALAGERIADALEPFLRALRSEPRNPSSLLNLCDLLEGGSVDGTTLDHLRLWICELALDASPDDLRIQAARTRVLDSLRSRTR
jgi:tetratricopeptide (TPR) repeat protein